MRCEVFTNYQSLKYNFNQRDLKVKQRRQLELIKDYGLNIQYDKEKVNMVVNGLSRKHQLVQTD